MLGALGCTGLGGLQTEDEGASGSPAVAVNAVVSR